MRPVELYRNTPESADEEILSAERPAVASLQTDDERLARVQDELTAGFAALEGLGPAGFGTLAELFDAVTLIQTRRVRSFPLVLLDSSYWSGLLAWLRERPAAEGEISPPELELIRVTDDPDEAAEIISAGARDQGMA